MRAQGAEEVGGGEAWGKGGAVVGRSYSSLGTDVSDLACATEPIQSEYGGADL